jgi:hypothetical protein
MVDCFENNGSITCAQMLRLVRGKALELLSEFFENVQQGKHVEQHVNLSLFGGLFGLS